MDSKPKTWKLILVGICAGVLLTGTLAVASPAVASAPVKIGKIWKAIKKKADKRYYTKANSNARYAAKPTVIRGTYIAIGVATGANQSFGDNISFGVTFSAPPTPHVIAPGGVLPTGCSGTIEAPSASPGHLCIFQGYVQNNAFTYVFSSSVNAINVTSRMGALVVGYSSAAGSFQNEGSWAASPLAITPKVAAKPNPPLSKHGIDR